MGLKINHIGLKINALESLYIESQLKITPLLLKIELQFGLKIDGGRRRYHLKIEDVGLKIG